MEETEIFVVDVFNLIHVYNVVAVPITTISGLQNCTLKSD